MSATRPQAVVWHELECGSYNVDLPLWHELAQTQTPAGTERARVLDLGAGSGRVAVSLARDGHHVNAVEIDPELAQALAARSLGLPLEVLCADACDFRLADPRHDLCLVPMQTIQLLEGEERRAAMLACARAHLRPGGLLACAIVTEVDPFDARRSGIGPSPERVRVDGRLYVSRPLRVASVDGRILIERRRRGPDGVDQHDSVSLAQLNAAGLHAEMAAAGLQPAGVREIAATDEHSGSLAVMARA